MICLQFCHCSCVLVCYEGTLLWLILVCSCQLHPLVLVLQVFVTVTVGCLTKCWRLAWRMHMNSSNPNSSYLRYKRGSCDTHSVTIQSDAQTVSTHNTNTVMPAGHTTTRLHLTNNHLSTRLEGGLTCRLTPPRQHSNSKSIFLCVSMSQPPRSAYSSCSASDVRQTARSHSGVLRSSAPHTG